MLKNRFRAATTALAGILIAIGGCAESPSSPAAPKFLVRGPMPSYDLNGVTSAVIDGRGGTVQSPAGDRIVFPAGAVSLPVLVTITSDRKYVGVELQPHGTLFMPGREPTLYLNAGSSVPTGATIVYTDDSGAITEVLNTSIDGAQARASLPHFSKYYLAGG